MSARVPSGKARAGTIAAVVTVALVLAAACGGDGGSSGVPGGPGGAVSGVTFDWASHEQAAPGSDNWPITWSDDDHQYAVWGDGGGFGGTDSKGRSSFGVARIEGSHEAHRGFNRFGGEAAECRSNIDGKAHGAPLSVGGILYAWITPGSDAGGYRSSTLYRSTDKACSWRALDVRFVRSTHGISYGSFVQFGRDHTLATDGYVYSIATRVRNTESLHVVQRPGSVMLLRVPVTAIEDPSAYEFFAGLDGTGQPIWSFEHTDKKPIYEDPDGVGPFPQMSYVPGLNRFIYTNQHGDGRGTTSSKSLLTIAEAPHPWGPWTVVYRDLFFPQHEQTIFQWNLSPKWFRNGGREFTLVFSGIESNDSWNTVDGTFHLAQ